MLGSHMWVVFTLRRQRHGWTDSRSPVWLVCFTHARQFPKELALFWRMIYLCAYIYAVFKRARALLSATLRSTHLLCLFVAPWLRFRYYTVVDAPRLKRFTEKDKFIKWLFCLFHPSLSPSPPPPLWDSWYCSRRQTIESEQERRRKTKDQGKEQKKEAACGPSPSVRWDQPTG